jgi:cell wall-associated NlpC family hydrolase
MATSVMARWTWRLGQRRRLEGAARTRHVNNPTAATARALARRKAQVAYAVRVVRRRARGVSVRGNAATGGTPRQRVVAAAHRAAYLHAIGRRPSFYSQAGAWNVARGITGERRNERSDCSQWYTAMFHSAGLPDPNGNGYRGGYTGTLAGHGRSISRHELRPGDAVLYGPAPHHHVEMYVGPGETTIGHGTAPVDKGAIRMMPDVHFVTYSFLS